MAVQKSVRTTTNQIVASEISDPATASRRNQTANTQGGQIRFDGAIGSHRPHYRAQQLEEFTNWLSQSDIEGQPSASAGFRIEKLHRIDSKATSDNSRRPVAKPHFETASYQPPVTATPAVTPSGPTTATQIPTDGFDPLSGIRKKIAAQHKNAVPTPIAHDTFIASWQVPTFAWPEITTQLIGEPSGAIRSLCHNASQMMMGTGNRLLVTGAAMGVGTSTITMAMARQFAISGRRTLLVDANTTSPMLAARLGLHPSMSWLQAVSQRRAISEVVINSTSDKLHLMPLCPIVGRVSWPRAIFDQLGQLLFKLQSEFDLILIDGGKFIEMIAETTKPYSIADSFLLVSSQQRHGTSDMERAQSSLVSFGVRRLMVAQNFIPQKVPTAAFVG